MKIYKVLFLLTISCILSLSAYAQRGGVRIAYIDTEYILENVPEYQEASTQLETKVSKWKNEIESKLSAVEQKRKDLSNEKALLTKELIEEREEDILFEEKEILDYQQKRFGPNGDLVIQKKQLMQPVQDQIFAAVQDIATSRKYDFVFDKSADVVMLYSANRYDISDIVLRNITRASKRKQVQSRAERKEAESEELVPEEVNEEQEARQKALEQKKADRAAAVEKRRQEILDAREAKKKEAEARRQKILDDRAKAKQDKLDSRAEDAGEAKEAVKTTDSTQVKKEDVPKTREQLLEERRQQKLKDREARKKALEEKRKKILEEREKAKEEKENNN